VKRRAIFLAASVALVSVLLGSSVAVANPLMFESDLTEDGLITFCNPDQLKSGLFEEAISDWNSYAADESYPRIVDVTGNDGAFCELKADAQGGEGAGYLARVVFGVHPDNLDLSARFNDLPAAQRGATLRHELGHAVVGLDHNEMCSESIMPTLRFCKNQDTPRRTTVGPHDVADRGEYWNVAAPIYPIANKCWTNKDEDGDGVCDVFGPPETLRVSSFGGEAVWAPSALED
jgi:hypothetical protein